MERIFKITFSGGYHNKPEINMNIQITKESYIDYINNRIDKFELIKNNASSNQLKRLERYFCGVKRCTCGSWQRANIQEKNK